MVTKNSLHSYNLKIISCLTSSVTLVHCHMCFWCNISFYYFSLEASLHNVDNCGVVIISYKYPVLMQWVKDQNILLSDPLLKRYITWIGLTRMITVGKLTLMSNLEFILYEMLVVCTQCSSFSHASSSVLISFSYLTIIISNICLK